MGSGIERLIGRALRTVRAGDRHLAWNDPRLAAPETIRLASPIFADRGPMPASTAGQGVGQNLSPPLVWSNLPEGAADLVLIVEDPDVPVPRPIVHLMVAIAATESGVVEGALTPGADGRVRFGAGAFGRVGYAGPRPVRGHGPHRYLFQIYAVKKPVVLDRGTKLGAVAAQMAGSVLARGLLTGTYERK